MCVHISFALVYMAKSQFSECLTEQDFKYYGNNVNDRQSNKQPDVESCRASCMSIAAGYFTWHPDERCNCKSSDAGREQSNGDVSGETCLGETCYHTHKYIPPMFNHMISRHTKLLQGKNDFWNKKKQELSNGMPVLSTGLGLHLQAF